MGACMIDSTQIPDKFAVSLVYYRRVVLLRASNNIGCRSLAKVWRTRKLSSEDKIRILVVTTKPIILFNKQIVQYNTCFCANNYIINVLRAHAELISLTPRGVIGPIVLEWSMLRECWSCDDLLGGCDEGLRNKNARAATDVMVRMLIMPLMVQNITWLTEYCDVTVWTATINKQIKLKPVSSRATWS